MRSVLVLLLVTPLVFAPTLSIARVRGRPVEFGILLTLLTAACFVLFGVPCSSWSITS